MEDVKITGLDELLKSLKNFPVKVQKNALAGAVRASGAALVKEAKIHVPQNLGVLKKSITVRKIKSKNKNELRFIVGPNKKLLVKGLVAAGVKRKVMVSKKTGFKYSTFDNYGGYVEYGTPNVAAQPYLRPAFENKGNEAIDQAASYLEKKIDKEIEKAKQDAK